MEPQHYTFLDSLLAGFQHAGYANSILVLLALVMLTSSALIRERFFDVTKRGFWGLVPVTLTASGGLVIGVTMAVLYDTPALEVLSSSLGGHIITVSCAVIGGLSLWLMSPLSSNKTAETLRAKDALSASAGEDDEAIAGGAFMAMIAAIAVGFLVVSATDASMIVAQAMEQSSNVRLNAVHAVSFAVGLVAVYAVVANALTLFLGRIMATQNLAIALAALPLCYTITRLFGIL